MRFNEQGHVEKNFFGYFSSDAPNVIDTGLVKDRFG